MGKGGGRGRGRGGCECFEAMHAFACCLCLVLVGGPILIAIGASILAAAARNNRAHNIDYVQAAVTSWNSPSSPDGWQQFQKLAVFATLTAGPGVGLLGGASCPAYTVALTPDTRSSDTYSDEADTFAGVQQLRLTAAGLSYADVFNCQRQVTLLQQVPGASSNTTLAVLPAAADPTQSYTIAVDKATGPRSCPTRSDTCGFGSNYRNCMYNCENYFGGTFSCSGGTFYCYLNNAYFNNMAVKVAFNSSAGGSGAYAPDFVNPGAGGGANAMPAGFTRQYSSGNFSGGPAAGPVFQLQNISSPSSGLPSTFSLTVRSSADPWLAYMQATGGSGYFGVSKRVLVASGVILLIVGCAGTGLWCLALWYAWRMLCARHRPTARPQGVGGYAWDLANRYGGSYAPAIGVPVTATGPGGLPTAAPLYAPAGGAYSSDPATGQPATGYPYPYAYPYPPYGQQGAPAGGYPGYAAQTAYPYPPGTQVEMAQYPYSAPQYHTQQQAQPPQGYGYPPAAGASQQPAGDAGATASYAYPYPYAYPQYGQQAPAGGAGPSAMPPPPEAGPSGAVAGGHGGAGPSNSAMPPPGYPKN